MPAKSAVSDNTSKLEQKLTRLQAAERKKFKNEDILRLEKNGDISYERVRTVAVPREDAPLSRRVHAAPAELPADAPVDREENPAKPNLLPNKLPQTPETQENGNLIGGLPPPIESQADAIAAAQINVALALTATSTTARAGEEPAPADGISCHEAENSGNQVGQASLPARQEGRQECLPHSDERDPLEELLYRAIAAAKVRRGRPPALDEHVKGQLVALLSVGMSMRQAASVLGVSHTTVQKTLKADPALSDEINAARFQAQLQPLACVIREARRSWKAATWLLKYLDAKIATHEETPDERRQRQQRESDEFFGRSPAPGVTKRRELA